MSEYISTSIATQRFHLLLLGAFALVALLLAALGIYGVMSHAVTQRTREIGIRMALGAQPNRVFRIIIGQGMALTLIGVIVGIMSASALTRILRSLLYGVSPLEPFVFALIASLLILIAAGSCYFPARRATKIDPVNALREE